MAIQLWSAQSTSWTKINSTAPLPSKHLSNDCEKEPPPPPPFVTSQTEPNHNHNNNTSRPCTISAYHQQKQQMMRNCESCQWSRRITSLYYSAIRGCWRKCQWNCTGLWSGRRRKGRRMRWIGGVARELCRAGASMEGTGERKFDQNSANSHEETRIIYFLRKKKQNLDDFFWMRRPTWIEDGSHGNTMIYISIWFTTALD